MHAYLKPWATPLTIGAFLLSAVTGILIFFHWDTGLNKPAHEWLGWALVAGVAAHVVLHFPSFKKHLKRPVGAAIVGLFVLVLGLSFITLKEGETGNPMRMAVDVLTKAPLTDVAPLLKTTPEALVQTLQTKGFAVNNPAMDSVASIAGGDRGKQMAMMTLLFAKPTK